MTLRPSAATWFELLTARDELSAALRCLAGTGQVELQSRSAVSAVHLLPILRNVVDEHRRLSRRYSEYWPVPTQSLREQEGEPEQIAAAALRRVRAWAADADPLIIRIQQLAHEESQLRLLQRLLAVTDRKLPDLALFAKAGPMLATRIYLLTGPEQSLDIPPAVLTQRVTCGEQTFLLAVGRVEEIAVLDEVLSARKARHLGLPAQSPATHRDVATQVNARLEEIPAQSAALAEQLQDVHRRHSVATALADLHFIEWLVQHVPELAATEHFAWVTGWTSDPTGARLEGALRSSGLHYLLRFPGSPPELVRPVVLSNPRWARPFEIFARLLGVPQSTEADPSRLLAVIAPLMFGYMFGDVGQGVVLIVAGLALHKRYPATALLIPGGAAAVVFGFLFGSVLTNEQILAPLWLRPMEQPLLLLGASLAFGVAVLLMGMVLDALQHYWAGLFRTWWATRAGLVLCYLGLVAAPLNIVALWAIPAGLAWHWIGSTIREHGQRGARLASAAGESVETLLQLAVNTLSFVRVGAFALAHAGLSAVVSDLASGVASAALYWLVMLIGNALIIAIEGLVVGIQTTRLVLFEFFIRFLRGSGRPFLPLPAPTAQPDALSLSRKSSS